MSTFVVGDIHGRCAQLLNLLDMLPRDPANDTLVFLGDLIDRGADAPGCVDHIRTLTRGNPERVICLRGNHEQMLMDYLAGNSSIWLTPVTGGERTFEQYTGESVRGRREQDSEELRQLFEQKFPVEHLEFLESLPFYYEDEHAIYVHAGLDEGKHPSESSPLSLLWMRDMDFYKNRRRYCLCADD
jgi:serine/threonine protein phosphatase 1